MRHGYPISRKLFAAVIEEIFKKADLDKGINIDGERLQILRFSPGHENNKGNGGTP